MCAGDDVRFALFLQRPSNCRADHAAVAGYVDFFLGLGAWHFWLATDFESEKVWLALLHLRNI